MIPVNPTLALDERDIEERFVRSSGPGGQNVNKVSSAVELRFRVDGYSPLPGEVRERLKLQAGRRLTLGGEIVIQADAHRDQQRNRADALARLIAMVERATHAPKPRHKTKVPRAERQRRLDHKSRRSDVKSKRGKVRGED